MKKSLSILFALGLLFGAQTAFAASSGTLVSDSSEVNVHADAVLSQFVLYTDYTEEAADSTTDDVPLGNFPVVYIGSNSPFDEIMFNLTTPGSSTRSSTTCVKPTECHHFDLDYYNGVSSSWESLSYTDNTNSFQTSGANSWEFTAPNAWSSALNTNTTIEGQTLYWVKISMNSNTTLGDTAYADEIALRAYNTKVTVKDELGGTIDELVSEDFDVSGGTSNELAAWRSLGTGVYELALDAGLADSNYALEVAQSGYVDTSTDTGTLGTSQTALTLTMDYAHRINVTDDAGAALTPSAVKIGSTTCTISGSSAYCAAGTSDDGSLFSTGTVTVSASGYETKTKTLAGQRDSSADAQVLTTVALTALSCDVPFMDIYGHWAEGYIGQLFCDGTVQGRDATHYVPNENVTRAEFLKIALLNAGFSVDGSTGEDFSDVSTGDWFYEYVSYGADHNYIEGYSDGSFQPNSPINRAEALVILMRIAGESSSSVSSSWSEFSDVSYKDWFAYAVKIAADNGIVEGYDDGSFRPGNEITRAEVSAMAVRTYNVYYAP